MDNQEIFIGIPGVPQDGVIYNNGVFIIRGRAQLSQSLQSKKENKWSHEPRYFTFPEMQEVCDTEVTIVVRDE